MAKERENIKAKTKPAAAGGKKKHEKNYPAYMTYRLSDILRETPGFETLPKQKRKTTYGKQEDNRQV